MPIHRITNSRFYITYMLSAVAGRPRLVVQKPLQALHKFPGFRAGGLPRFLRPERQWYLVDQPVDAIHPLEDLAKRHGIRSCSDRSLALAYVNSGARKIACRAAAGAARELTLTGKTIFLRASIDNACSGRWWRRMSFFLGEKALLFSLGVYLREASHLRSAAALRFALGRSCAGIRPDRMACCQSARRRRAFGTVSPAGKSA